MQGEGRREHSFLYQPVYSNLTLLLLAKQGSGEDLIQNAPSLHICEVVLPIVAAQEPEWHVQLILHLLSLVK